MALAVVYSRAVNGVAAPLVTVEVHLANGLPGLSIVGLPETAVRESKDRVRGAIINSGFEFPARRITINLAPADLPKEGGRFDLPIAIGILAASKQIKKESLEKYEFAGELALTGDLRPITGVIPVALQCGREKRRLILPSSNGNEARVIRQTSISVANNLLQVCHALNQTGKLETVQPMPESSIVEGGHDLEDVKGQPHARRALEIAAAGGHSLLFIGPPGTGKSMLASRLPGLLPPMSEDEAIETAAINSIIGQPVTPERWLTRTFRSPHHTSSAVALVGGGSNPRPGEISLAHNGVMFLDELPEFDRRVLEVLREPMETGRISISRAARQAEYPARFQLVAAMNPCPCGFFGDNSGRCFCSHEQIRRYRNKLSGPLLDRIDMHIEVPRISPKDLRESKAEENSHTVRQRVVIARGHQLKRQGKSNAQLSGREIEKFCSLQAGGNQLLDQAVERLNLSPRATHRIMKVARTIADMSAEQEISLTHLSEAIGYRRLDRGSV